MPYEMAEVKNAEDALMAFVDAHGVPSTSRQEKKLRDKYELLQQFLSKAEAKKAKAKAEAEKAKAKAEKAELVNEYAIAQADYDTLVGMPKVASKVLTKAKNRMLIAKHKYILLQSSMKHGPGVKRTWDEMTQMSGMASSMTSNTSKTKSSTRNGQKAFVERLVKRDRKCPITGTVPDGCEAAHIIPHCHWRICPVPYFNSLLAYMETRVYKLLL